MSRIEMRGVIVPSFYDSEWTREYIDKGLIIPESTFRRALTEADAKEPLEIYVNSPGGSVFSAYEMVNAVREWKAANKQEVKITVGAMAASAASTFVLMAGGKVASHQNAKFMFHGAVSETWAGKEAHEDTAELLGKINSEVQNILIQRHKLAPDTVAEWFAEGRMGWMDAEEAYRAGIVSEVIGVDAEPVQFEDADIKAIDGKGLDVAALLEGEKDGSHQADGDPEPPANQDPGKEPGSHGNNAPSAEYKAGRADGIAEGKAAIAGEYAEQIEKLKADLESANAAASKLQSERDKARADLTKANTDAETRCAALRSQLDEATEKLRKYVSGALTFSPAVETWEQALDACGGDYVKAKQNYPDLLKKFRAESNR